MKTLSIRQPWAWAILFAGKDIENRTWATIHRGPLGIHAGKTYDHEGRHFIENDMGIAVPDDLPRGGIVGRADMVDCVGASDSPWFFGPHGFVLKDPHPVPFTECRGRLGLFEAQMGKPA